VTESMNEGLTFGAPSRRELFLARKIKEMVPFIEKMRFVSSGTEAVMSALRAARGFTGRERILKFEGCYHGHSDGLLVKAGSGLITFGAPTSAGVPKAIAELTRWNAPSPRSATSWRPPSSSPSPPTTVCCSSGPNSSSACGNCAPSTVSS